MTRIQRINAWLRAHQLIRRALVVIILPVFVAVWAYYVVAYAYEVGCEIAAEWRVDFWG